MANKWFKHFNDSLVGDSLQNVLAVPKGHQFVVLWFYVLEMMSRQDSDTIVVDLAQMSRRIRLRVESILGGFSTLAEHTSLSYSAPVGQMCEIHLSNWSDLQDTGDKTKTKRKRKEEDKDIKHSKSVFDFDSVYKTYPRKEGKAKGLALARTQIKTEADYQALARAIERYSKHVQDSGTEPKYIKHFSTFMGSWRDWLDPETGTATAQKDHLRAWLEKREGARRD